jgi:hypothetical protein
MAVAWRLHGGCMVVLKVRTPGQAALNALLNEPRFLSMSPDCAQVRRATRGGLCACLPGDLAARGAGA